MFLRSKVVLVVILPLFLMAGYQFFAITNTFDVIEEVRSKIFVESSTEVKYATDVQFLTGAMTRALFELDTAYEMTDSASYAKALQSYREAQQQRYYSLRRLKETLHAEGKTTFQFIAILDEYHLEELSSIEQKLAELDMHNEEIISLISHNYDVNSDATLRRVLIQRSNTLTREIVGELAAFTNKRYIKVDEVSALVGETEKNAKLTLLMTVSLAYLVGAIIILFFYILVIVPLERFTRAIEKKSMDNIAWTSMEPFREDEIGVLYRTLDACFIHHSARAHASAKKKSRKRSAGGKNRNFGERGKAGHQ